MRSASAISEQLVVVVDDESTRKFSPVCVIVLGTLHLKGRWYACKLLVVVVVLFSGDLKAATVRAAERTKTLAVVGRIVARENGSKHFSSVMCCGSTSDPNGRHIVIVYPGFVPETLGTVLKLRIYACACTCN